jgi:hypothetical protein
LDHKELNALVLGDVSIVAPQGKSYRVLRDTRLSQVARPLRTSYKDALRNGQGFSKDHEEMLRKLRSAERKARNQDGKYWIAADDPEAADHALPLVESPPPGTVILASDGASASVSRYKLLPDWHAFAAAVQDPSVFVESIRRAERLDAEGQRWPRSKPHDDITALVLSQPAAPLALDPDAACPSPREMGP